MAHVRQQLREAVAAELNGNVALVGNRVFESRVYDLTDDELPCLLVYVQEENDAMASMDSGIIQRDMTLLVTAKVKTTTNFDDDVDAICTDVEKLICTSANPFIDGAQLISTIIDFDQTDQPIGSANITFNITLFTRAGNPELLI